MPTHSSVAFSVRVAASRVLMMDYAAEFSPCITPQSEPIPGSAQTPNSGGGFAWALGDWGRLDRFLVLGTENGTYYIKQRELTRSNAEVLLRCLKADGLRVVARIVEISEAGRAPKNDPAIFALALAASEGDPHTKAAALTAVPRVCRIGTHLFHFAQAVQACRGWGRSLRRAVGAWYAREADMVAYQAIKYAQRDGWTHRDLLRLCHLKPPTAAHSALFRWITKGEYVADAPALCFAMEELRGAQDSQRVAALVRQYRLPREAVEAADTKWLQAATVWEALLEDMSYTALIRNLARLTASGVIGPFSHSRITTQITDAENIRHARAHPIQLLSALKTYTQGHGERGKRTWQPVGPVVDALDAAFYLAFENAPSTGKRLMLALDVSGSMAGNAVAGVPGLDARTAAGAMALVIARREPEHCIMAFSHQLVPVTLSPRQRLDDVISLLARIPMGGTDCALPMVMAQTQKLDVDAFVVLTDSETWCGLIHPSQALVQYRQVRQRPAKLAVVGMCANDFTIADPNDGGMLDCVGFDTATPIVLADFIAAAAL